MVTSRDVARLAGVSQSTVSYAMSGRRSVSVGTRKRIDAAIAQLSYQPNAGARALASRRTQVIALVVSFGSGANTAGLLPFIEQLTLCAREQDHDVLLVTADEGAQGLTRLAARSLCDAIVLLDVESRDARIPVAEGLRVPVILIGIPERVTPLHCVDLDFELAGRMAVDELAATGHERVVLIGHPREVLARDINFVRRFQRGAAASAAGHGIAYDVVEPTGHGRAGARDAVDSVWDGGRGRRKGAGRVGFVVANSSLVQPVLQALLDRGLEPGRDLSVVALCTDAAAEASHPAVTNVSLEPQDVSRRAMQTLFRLLDQDRRDNDLPHHLPYERTELVTPRLTRRRTVVSHPAPPS
ncbi:LacI family DNA-binding transcriptional regulator [Streptomyces sp. NPDC102360]|uniref:LacI family DNA-binding transcriptional regulator n=1 Tax=Streptomyces sp. NPDC102360 TaxID=3366160 RepID=UPI0037F2D780